VEREHGARYLPPFMTTPRDAVRFCPRCAAPLVPRVEHGTVRPTCPRCGYIHYHNPVPAAGVILTEFGRVLLVKRRFDPRAGTWCLPAGFMESGETPEQTAVRELKEETGLAARLTGLFGVYAGFDDPRVRAVLILYTAERSGGELRPGDDAIETRFFPLVRLPRVLSFEAHRRALEEFRARPATAARPRRARASRAAPRAGRAAGPRNAERDGKVTPRRARRRS